MVNGRHDVVPFEKLRDTHHGIGRDSKMARLEDVGQAGRQSGGELDGVETTRRGAWFKNAKAYSRGEGAHLQPKVLTKGNADHLRTVSPLTAHPVSVAVFVQAALDE